MEGTHPIHRAIFSHWVWDDKPFAMGQAWVDLILLANYTDSKALLRGHVYEVRRGQVFRSKLVLGERWGWSRGKVERFFKLLEKDGMIMQQAGQHATFITLSNYDRLHREAFKKRTTNESSPEHQIDHSRGTYNKDKKDKNENKDKKFKKRSNNVFNEKQKAVLKKEIAEVMNHSVGSEANQLAVEALIERVAKAKDVKDKFGYAITSARNLKEGHTN